MGYKSSNAKPERGSANPRITQVTFKIQGPSKLVARLMADTALAALNALVVEIRRKHASAEREFLEGRPTPGGGGPGFHDAGWTQIAVQLNEALT